MLNNIFSLNKGKLLEIKEAVAKGRDSMVFYAHETNRCHITACLNKPFLYIAGDIVSAQRIHEILSDYCSGEVVLIPEKEDVLITMQIENQISIFNRISALYKMYSGNICGAVITIEGLMQLYPNIENFKNNIVEFVKGQAYDTSMFADKLIQMGYKRKDIAEEICAFVIRGDVLDIFPCGENMPLRIEFFGDTIDRIRRISAETMLSTEELDSYTLLPASDILIPQNCVEGILNKAKKAKRNKSARLMEIVDSECEKFYLNSSNPLRTFLIPLMREHFDSIYKYLPENTIVVFDDVRMTDDKLKLYQNSFASRVKSLIQGGKLLPEHNNSILSRNEIYDIPFTKLGFSKITSINPVFAPKESFAVRTQPVTKYYLSIQELFEDLKNFELNNFYVKLFASDKKSAEELQSLLRENMMAVDINGNGLISIILGNVGYGFVYPQEKLVAIGYKDYTRQVAKIRAAKHKRQAFILPAKGDYVVHEKHGIGISEGIQKIETSSGAKDFYVVLYRGGDRLYLPADQLDTLEKYNGADTPILHKIGGAEFERVKRRVRESVKAMAIDLLSLYQSRYRQKGFIYQPDTVWQEEMEKDFEYAETDDQLIAVNEIKEDMEKGRIMDRLLCGDVGYGKTEVALRAIFKTVMDNKQAVILAPTTILAQQHYNLITTRFNKYKLNIDLLSRFVPPKQIEEALKRIENGKTNIIVATHRVLSSDVKFHDLGLLVLDEEQRFGVEHKEKLKTYKNKINILSLSATPIPRTLHMALSGIRDISTLEEPPKDRLPVETYVTEYSDSLLISAVNKEISRGGQVFILYNRVASIDSFYKKTIGLLDKNISVIYAHGQMREDALEDRIRDFYENKAQVLISTTIIENGIDLPNANTLFVIDSDRLGLSQLYQLRGRVGRSNILAYAYFTVQEGKVLTENAVKRLDALMENTELGSGFRIAMRDLEIRGAGNVLGREQHGQMEKVGYEMYLKLVQEGIEEAKGAQIEKKEEIELAIDGSYALPENYITESRARVSFYRKVSLLSTIEEARDYQVQLNNMYGKMPYEVMNIIRISLIKNLAQKIRASKVAIGGNGIGVYFRDEKALSNEKLMNTVSDFANYVLLVPSEQPVIVFSNKYANQTARIKSVLRFLCSSVC